MVVSSRPTYSIGCTLLYVPGKNVSSKDGGSWIGILCQNIKKSTCRLRFVTLVIALEQHNSLISYTVCPIYYLVLPLTLACRRRETTERPIVPFQTSYPPYLLLSSSTCNLILNILYPPLSITLFTKKKTSSGRLIFFKVCLFLRLL